MTEPDSEQQDPEDLELTILGHSPDRTSADVASAAGVTLEDARRLWRALGFPDAGEHLAFNDADLDALTTLTRAVHTGVLDFDTAVRMTRAVGRTMARLADWQIGTLTKRVESRQPGDGSVEGRTGTTLRLREPAGIPFEKLLIYAWRRHLAAAVARVDALGSTDEEVHEAQVTVGFADLVGFTALSNEMDEERLGDMVEVFESRCADVVASHHGRVIKTLGDSVLFISEGPVRGIEIALSIIEVIGKDSRLPDVRVGLSTGSVVLRLGDVFGPAVNMAARLTGVARRNRVITDHATADLLPSDRFAARPLPGRPLRGFGVVEPVAVRLH